MDLRNSEREGKEGGKGVAVKGSYANDDNTDYKIIDRSALWDLKDLMVAGGYCVPRRSFNLSKAAIDTSQIGIHL